MNICVIGVGYVGLVTGACFAEFGLRVTCVDKDAERIGMLQKGLLPFFEPGLEEILRKNLQARRLSFVTDIARAVKDSLVIFIAVGTPSLEDGSADLSYVEEVARVIAEQMDDYKVIVTKSTVPVGTGERIREIILKHQPRANHFDIVSNPEFLREGSAIEDFMRPNRVIIGAESPQAVAILRDLYRPLYLIETPFVVTDVKTAELIKYASNAFLATKISFINEVAHLCERVGADVHVVAKGMGLDQRIGGKFLHPGPGFGGSCFPKDTQALARIAQSSGYRFEILETVLRVNARQMERMAEKIRDAVGGVQGKTLGVLGLSFKPNTDDIREAPALKIIEILLREGAAVRAFDPAAMEAARRVYPQVLYCEDPYEAARGSDALIIVTEWNLFRNLDLGEIKRLLRLPVLLDLRNIYDPEKARALGLRYYGVGRGTV
ncbi:MAG: UDP-glucose/GDP-mannose dehydrogenase family protein [Nitrospirae bacterium]|nr:UDP-glucose/GDP-mannose dehydrogenase family protein [Nitrospirota bacterium]